MSTREVINIQVGGCGNNIGNELLYRMLNEHWLDYDGVFRNKPQYNDISQIETRLNKINSYFREINTKLFDGYIRYEIEQKYSTFIPNDIKNILKYYLLNGCKNGFYPRTILVDLDPSNLDQIKMSNIAHLFRQSNFHSSTSSAGNNWARGHYTEGPEIVDEIVDSIRNEVEQCDAVQAFQICNSLSGGTGSGLGTLLLLKLRDNYPDCLNAMFSVITRSSWIPEVKIEPYNQTLSLHQMLENADIVTLFDNEKLRNISYNILRQNEPKYCDYNWIASMSMSGITSTLRLGTRNNLHENWRKMAMNMVTFPRLHFLLSSPAPLFNRKYEKKIKLTVHQLYDQMNSDRNFMCNVRWENGKCLTAAHIYRGTCCEQEVDDEVAKIGYRMVDDWVTWIPNNMKSTVVDVSFNNLDINKSGVLLSNTTALKEVFQSIAARFAVNYRRKSFLHWYKGEGMDEMEFQESDSNVRDLITENQDKQDAVFDLEEDED
eukprot:2490_1